MVSYYVLGSRAIRFAPLLTHAREHKTTPPPSSGPPPALIHEQRRFFQLALSSSLALALYVIYLAISRNNPSLVFSPSQNNLSVPSPYYNYITYQEPYSSPPACFPLHLTRAIHILPRNNTVHRLSLASSCKKKEQQSNSDLNKHRIFAYWSSALCSVFSPVTKA